MPAREVTSNQTTTHKHLTSVVQKHLDHTWRKPISAHSLEVFAQIQAWVETQNRDFILDSGCGIGESSVELAARFPNSSIVGFDRSEVRLDKLARKTLVPDNCIVVRADANDLWRQLVSAGMFPSRHYLLYPNPYPKAAQFNQRWHGSPVFPYLLALGGTIEVRSNWRIYLEEFQQAIELATDADTKIEPLANQNAISAFEKKYHSAGQSLWRLTTQISPPTFQT